MNAGAAIGASSGAAEGGFALLDVPSHALPPLAALAPAFLSALLTAAGGPPRASAAAVEA